MSEAVAISIEALSVCRRGRTILQLEHLEVRRGQVVGLLGPNGAGKTTLLRTCTGYIRPTRGGVMVLGERVDRLGMLGITRLRQRVGYVPQMPAVAGELPITVREVVAIGRTGVRGLLRRLTAEDWRCIDAWIEKLSLGHVADLPYAEASGGEQRKAVLARAMVQQPELLLLDEPASNLDPGAREQIVHAIQTLHEQMALPVVLVCHEVEVLPPACRRVVLLEAGQLRADGPPEEVLTDERVRSLYGQGLAVVHRGGRHAVLPAMEVCGPPAEKGAGTGHE